eukprot:g10310.t1
MTTQQQRSARGRKTALHKAACGGSSERTIALLSRGLINIDQGDPDGWTPLMYAAAGGHSRVAQILLSRGANACIATDAGTTALHLSAEEGQLALTVDLIKAGADVRTEESDGATPLHLAARNGHSHVMATLIEAGAHVDSCSDDRGTPLREAALDGHLDAVKQLLRAKANPLLAAVDSEGRPIIPLDSAAELRHLEVVRELIQQVGIEGCGGETRGENALEGAAMGQHLDVMAMLMDAGVVDTGKALLNAARRSWEAQVKLLLRRRQQPGSPAGLVDYVQSRDEYDATPLFNSIDGFDESDDVRHTTSLKVVRLLIDAGADTSSVVLVTNTPGGDDVYFNGTPLAFTKHCLANKMVGGRKRGATDEQMNRLEAVRRLLLRVEAVHAVSWLWEREPLLVRDAAQASSKTARETAASSGALLASMLLILRRRRRGVLLGPLLRYSSRP